MRPRRAALNPLVAQQLHLGQPDELANASRTDERSAPSARSDGMPLSSALAIAATTDHRTPWARTVAVTVPKMRWGAGHTSGWAAQPRTSHRGRTAALGPRWPSRWAGPHRPAPGGHRLRLNPGVGVVLVCHPPVRLWWEQVRSARAFVMLQAQTGGDCRSW